MKSSPNPYGRPQGERFGIIEGRIGEDESIPANVWAVYTYLCLFADADTRECHPSQARMAAKLNLSPGTISAAVKIGVQIGLWTVSKTRSPRNTYWLHDQAWKPNAYVVGSGPGGKPKGKPRGRHAPAHPQTVKMDPSYSEGKQDHGTAPIDRSGEQHSRGGSDSVVPAKDQHSRGGARASSRRHTEPPTATATPPKITLMANADYFNPDVWKPQRANQYLVGAVVKALAKAGHTMAFGARDRVGAHVLRAIERGYTRVQLIEGLERAANDALVGHPSTAWMIDPTITRADTINLETFLGLDKLSEDARNAELTDYLVHVKGCHEATVSSLIEEGYHANAVWHMARAQDLGA